jgi:hypothetical protein
MIGNAGAVGYNITKEAITGQTLDMDGGLFLDA